MRSDRQEGQSMFQIEKGTALITLDRKMIKESYAEITEENRTVLQVTSFLAAMAFAAMTFASAFMSSISKNKPVYAIYFLLCLISYILSEQKESEKAVRVHVYLFDQTILSFGVVLGAVFSPNELSASFMGLVLAVPLVFTMTTFPVVCLLGTSLAAYLAIGSYTQTSGMLLYNLVSILIFSGLSILLSAFMTNIKAQKVYYRKESRDLQQKEKEDVERAATHDKLTGCKNRNALNWVYEGEFDRTKPMTVVMCDLNGLKQVNDLQGHVAGDTFISNTSKALCETFGMESVYRIGGDEFLVLLTEEETEGFEKKLEALRITVGNTVSFGYEQVSEVRESFDELLSKADRKMYREKQQYYVSHPERKDGHQAVMEYRDILSGAGIGIWHIYLKDGSAPRMQADEKMAELLNVDAETMTEEQVYSAWFDRIVPEALPSVNASVSEMLSGRFSENTYLWNHPVKGNIYVRCGGSGILLPDGTNLLRGYHTDVTGIVETKARS